MIDHIPKLFGLVFLLLTFGYSAFEKGVDFKGQTHWLKAHFSHQFSTRFVQIALTILIILDLLVSALSILGIVQLWCCNNWYFGMIASVWAGVTILCLLLGQRVAKDYQGAANLTVYFGVILLIIWLFAT